MACMRTNGKPRSLTEGFKAGAARLVPHEGRTVAVVARELDVWESVLHGQVRQAKAESGKGAAGVLTSSEEDELAKLRRAARLREQERDVGGRRSRYSMAQSRSSLRAARSAGIEPSRLVVAAPETSMWKSPPARPS